MYVGITRARKILYMTRARSRNQRSSLKARSPSRFLAEVPEHLYETREAHVPVVAVEDEDAFARAQLEKMKKLFD